MSQEGTKIHSKSKSAYPDWLSTFLIVFFYFWWVMFVLVQIKTTENIFSPTKYEVNVFNPDITVLAQVPGIFFGWNGNLPAYVVAVGYIIEAVYMASLIRLKPMLERSKAIHPKHADILLAFLIACFAVNLGSDYFYGPDWYPPLPFVGHLLYAVIAELALIYFPIIADALSG